jgi:hypothetical protein
MKVFMKSDVGIDGSAYDDLPEEIKHYIQKRNREIVACSQCQISANEDGVSLWLCGVNYEVGDYLEDKCVPEEYVDVIISYMECPQCGKVFKDYSAEIGVMSEYEAYFCHRYDEIVEKTKVPIQSFYDFLSKYPYLGLEHEVGLKIKEEIKEMDLIPITDELFYRARKIEKGKIFTHEDMLNPPQTITIPEGRFNHFGQSHLYLGNSEELCANEISNGKEELLCIQKFKIKQLTRVLDLSTLIYEDNIDERPLFFSGFFISKKISTLKSTDKSWTPEYFIPRFIADIAKNNEINGIIYSSQKTHGKNLVIFDPKKDEYEFDSDPYTFVFNRKRSST